MTTQVTDVKLEDSMSWLLSCVHVCAARAGREWELPLLAAIFGHAFESSYALGGGELWSGCWGLVEGVDPQTKEYLVCHSSAGRFRTPADGLGKVDGVEWLYAFSFDGPDRAYSDSKTVGATVSDALLYLRGERMGADMPAPLETIRHGPGAFYEWASEVGRGANVGKARWCARGRDAAARFCAWARAAVPAVDAPLAEAERAFRAQADVLSSLADGGPSADAIRRVATLQDDAITALSRVPLG